MSPWAYLKIAAATAAFMVVDYPEGKTLRPQHATIRAEAATFIWQAAAWDGLVPIEAVTGYRKFHIRNWGYQIRS